MIPPKTSLSAPYFRLLQWFWKKGPADERTLSKGLDMSRTILSRFLLQGEQEGIIQSLPEGNFGINAHYGTVLGLHLGTQHIKAILLDFDANILLKREIPFPEDERDITAVIQKAVDSIEEARSPSWPLMRGLAISTPGLVDPYKLILLESNPLNVHNPVALKETIGRSLSRPITAENDANCCCWAEAVLNRKENLGNFVSVLADYRPYQLDAGKTKNLSVGLGLYLGGSVYYGKRFGAGEFQSVFKTDATMKLQFSMADQKMNKLESDEEVQAMIAIELAKNVAFLVNILNLDRVYFSWPIAAGHSRVLEEFRTEILQHSSYSQVSECLIEPMTLGAWSSAYGAAALHLESLFQSHEGKAPYFPGKS